MSELAALFELLRKASVSGDFVEALKQSPLGDSAVTHHPLGFSAARLINGSETLRLHIWPPMAHSAQPGYEVHDHAFDFKAHVLLGQMEQETYDVSAHSAGAFASYTVLYTSDGSELSKKPGRFDLAIQSRTAVSTLQTYQLSGENPHRIINNEQACATLVLTQHVKTDVTTFGPFDGPKSLKFVRRQTGKRAWEEYLAISNLHNYAS